MKKSFALPFIIISSINYAHCIFNKFNVLDMFLSLSLLIIFCRIFFWDE